MYVLRRLNYFKKKKIHIYMLFRQNKKYIIKHVDFVTNKKKSHINNNL